LSRNGRRGVGKDCVGSSLLSLDRVRQRPQLEMISLHFVVLCAGCVRDEDVVFFFVRQT